MGGRDEARSREADRGAGRELKPDTSEHAENSFPAYAESARGLDNTKAIDGATNALHEHRIERLCTTGGDGIGFRHGRTTEPSCSVTG